MSRAVRPLALRRVGAAAWAASLLQRRYVCECARDGEAALNLTLSFIRRLTPRRPGALAVSTRFGAFAWFDHEPFLIACTGVDVGQASGTAAREAFTQYALSALSASLHEALGEPIALRESPDLAANERLTACLTADVRGARLAMRFAAAPESFVAMLEDGPWRPRTAPLPPWLAALPAGCRVPAAEIALPAAQCRTLDRGTVIIAPEPLFDVTGRGRITLFQRQLVVSWRHDHHCFEVLHVCTDASPAAPEHLAAAPETPAGGTGELPVRLTFSLGALTLPLGEVAAVRRGTLLRLNGGPPPAVRIEANGVPLGYGELVDFDGRLAIEITEWPDREQRPLPAS